MVDRPSDARLNTMTEAKRHWTEGDSATFIDLADVSVPGRSEQIEMLLSLVPARAGRFDVLELCCGEGILASSLLERFPGAQLLALDGSPTMLDRARERLEPFGERAQIEEFDLASDAWLQRVPEGLHAGLSSLALHHLSGADKRQLFHALAQKLAPGGALLIADVVEPASETVRIAFRDLMNDIAKEQSLALTGSLEAFRTFQEEEWNGFALEQQPPGEMPSRLVDQLKWLELAGFSQVDCFWMRAGVAIFGGYR